MYASLYRPVVGPDNMPKIWGYYTMGSFRLTATLKWRHPQNEGLVFIEHNEGQFQATVNSHVLSAAGLRALAEACNDAADHIDAVSGDLAQVRVTPIDLAPERPLLVPPSALQAQAVSAPVGVQEEGPEPADEEEDLGPPVEVRRAPRAPQGPRPGAPPRARNIYPTGGYGG